MTRRGPSSTIIVYFKRCARSILNELELRGTSVSSFLGQWAVEVPLGKEEEYIKILEEIEEVKSVNKYPLYGNNKRYNKRSKLE